MNPNLDLLRGQSGGGTHADEPSAARLFSRRLTA